MQKIQYRFSLIAGALFCVFVSSPLNARAAAATAPEISAIEKTAESSCQRLEFNGETFAVCHARPQQIRLFLADENGKILNYFRNVRSFLARYHQKPIFLMNAGMYHKDFSPVGLYVSESKELFPLNHANAAGNFFMKPNGVFYIAHSKAGLKAGVMETEAFARAKIKPQLATQSGPMLVINSKIHPKFIANSKFREYRNGVGVSARGEVFFVISEGKVNFYDFATFFRDGLHCPNALFLDGSIASLYAPGLRRVDWFFAMGPMIGAVENKAN